MAKAKSSISGHLGDLQASQQLAADLEGKRRQVIERICALEPHGPPRADPPAISSIRERVAALLNGGAPGNLFAGKNEASELHGLINLELPSLAAAIQINQNEMIRIGGLHYNAVIEEKAPSWQALNRERVLALARVLAAFRKCDEMQAQFQQASPGSISIVGMNLQLILRHGQQPKTSADIFEMAIAQGWATRQEIEKALE